jgi:hypothetical protein
VGRHAVVLDRGDDLVVVEPRAAGVVDRVDHLGVERHLQPLRVADGERRQVRRDGAAISPAPPPGFECDVANQRLPIWISTWPLFA